MSSEILRRSTNGDLSIVDDKSDFGPLANRVEIDTAIDERLSQVATTRLERVRANRHRSLGLVRLQELDELGVRELTHELLH